MINSKNNINIIGENCFGCASCVQICTQSAIEMRYNKGFLYPFVDTYKCTKCGMCLEHCPVNFKFNDNIYNQKCYAAYSNDEIAKDSSSGGIFTILGEYILEQGGVVCGAAFDDEWLVHHILVDNKKDLFKLKTSKYVQSNTKKVYSEIKNTLENNKLVLFTGTPCQVAGLYAFLEKKYKNLYTVDIFCHGVPSPLVWKKYINEITDIKDIININFRDKNINKDFMLNNKGWEDFSLTITKKNGEIFSQNHRENIFFKGFLKNLYLRSSCYICPFTRTLRCGDMSIGDFWGYQRIDKKRDISKGMSAIIINSKKGEQFFQKINIDFKKDVKISEIVLGNSILKEPVKKHKNYNIFMNQIIHNNVYSVVNLINEYTEDKNVGVLNFSSITWNNYGAVLVGYAMEQAIKKLGYTPYTINFIPHEKLFYATNDNPFENFRKTFMNLTGIVTNKVELLKYINNKFSKICIGSDQVLRWSYDFIYYLDWFHGNKNLISYAASFGTSTLKFNMIKKYYIKYCVNRFDSFSVREDSSVTFFKNELNINSKVVCDPTLLISSSEYQKIIDKEAKEILPNEYIAIYFLQNNKNILSGITLKIIDAYRDDYGNLRSVGDWLNIIKNAKYVITDSFHGSIFSIIFKKEFITLSTKNKGNERLVSLMKQIGIDRFITDKNISMDLFNDKIDYNKIDTQLDKMRKDGFCFLANSLSIKQTYKKIEKRKFSIVFFIYFIFKECLIDVKNILKKIKFLSHKI